MKTKTPKSSKKKTVVKYVPFTILIPRVKPGQRVGSMEIIIPVKVEDGIELMTPEAHALIDRVRTQMIISRLSVAVRELYSLLPK